MNHNDGDDDGMSNDGVWVEEMELGVDTVLERVGEGGASLDLTLGHKS